MIPRSEHTVSRADISENALKVLYRLNRAGYEAYLVGGGVRDLLLGLRPKDFDVVTNATPEQVKQLFRNCRLVGRRFRLAHILFGRDVIEVATMRGHHETGEQQPVRGDKKGKDTTHAETGMILRDNVYGTIEEDAERRDFSINALYYNIADYSVLDFANGLEALQRRRIELIGDPETRYREDPVRMLRAIRFATKLEMTISPATAEPIHALAELLSNIPPARLFEEIQKLFLGGHGLDNFHLLHEYGLLLQLFPQLKPVLTAGGDSTPERFIEAALVNTDRRVRADKRVTPAFLIAIFLWEPVQRLAQEYSNESGLPYHDAFSLACNDVLDRQQARIAVPKRFSSMVKEIWQMQLRLPKRQGKRAERLREHPRFRAAYDFLVLRGQISGGELKQLGEWWTAFQESAPEQRQNLMREAGGPRTPRRRRPRRKPKPKPGAE